MIGLKKCLLRLLAILGSVNSFVPTKNQVKCLNSRGYIEWHFGS